MKRVQFVGGPTSTVSGFVGRPREILVDTTESTLTVHDGVTPGGRRMLPEDGDGSNVVVTATGATTTRKLKDRFTDVVNVKDFGAKGDGATDDTAAIQAAVIAGGGRAVYFPPGVYKVTTTITVAAHNTTLFGDGALCTRIVGNFAAGDIVYVGIDNTDIEGIRMRGILIGSSVTKTSGAAVHFSRLARADLRDLVAAGEDEAEFNNTLWDGFWFDGFSTAVLQSFQAHVQNSGIIMNGVPGHLAGDLFVIGGRIQYCALGMHLAGGCGGVNVLQTSILANDQSLLIDQANMPGTPNRDAWFGDACYFDTATGVNVEINNGATNTLSFQGASIATSGGHGIWVRDLDGTLLLSGVFIGGAGGDGLRIEDPNCYPTVSGVAIVNCGGRGWNQVAAPANWDQVRIAGLTIRDNATGEANGLNYLTIEASPSAGAPKLRAAGAGTNINATVEAKGTGAFVADNTGRGALFQAIDPGGSGAYANTPQVKPATGTDNVTYGATAPNGGINIQANGAGNVQLRTGGGLQAAALDVPGATRWLTLKGSVTDPTLGVSAGRLALGAPTLLAGYTVTTLPSAAAYDGTTIRIGDRNNRLASSDGYNWRFQDNSIVS